LTAPRPMPVDAPVITASLKSLLISRSLHS
jgi:hypothetical protein